MSGPRIIQDRRVGLAGWAAPRELRFITIVMRQPWTLAWHSDSVGWSPGHWTLQHHAAPHPPTLSCSVMQQLDSCGRMIHIKNTLYSAQTTRAVHCPFEFMYNLVKENQGEEAQAMEDY